MPPAIFSLSFICLVTTGTVSQTLDSLIIHYATY